MTHNPRELVLNFGEKHKGIPQLKFIAENQDDLKITRLTGGFVNYLYLVQSADGQNSVVIKYGEEQASHEIITAQYSLKRQEIEYNCMKLIQSLCPGGVAKPYVLDQEMNIIAMEYLENMEVLGPVLSSGRVDPDVASKLGTILGKVHFNTHHKVVSEETWKEIKRSLVEQSNGGYMYYCFTAIEEFDKSVLDPPDVPQYQKFIADIKFRGIFKAIKEMFMQEDCLIHLDSHNLSAMFSQERAAFIDFEFGGLGHVSLSLGYLLSFYYMATKDTRNERKNDSADLIEATKKAMRNMVDAFLSEFGDRVDVIGSKGTFISGIAARLGHTIFIFPLYRIFSVFIQTGKAERNRFVEQGYQLLSTYQTISTLDEIFSVIFD